MCAAGSFDLSTTAKLLKLRGQAMQQAVPVGQGAMAALLGADLALAQKIADAAAQGEVCAVANDNDPSQVVISGHKGAIDRAIEMAKEMGAKRALPLPVSAPFHCPLMQPAAEAMRDALGYVVLDEPMVPLFANVTAQPETDPDTIRNQLVEQVTGMVRWRESVANMAEAGVDEFVELGGKVLGPHGQAHRARREGDERGDDRGHRSAGEGDRMMFDLSGMTALVTGASGGLGSAIAKALAAQGARLAVSGSNVDKLESFRGEPRRRSCRAAVQPVRRRRGRPARAAGASRRSAASSTSSSTMPA